MGDIDTAAELRGTWVGSVFFFFCFFFLGMLLCVLCECKSVSVKVCVVWVWKCVFVCSVKTKRSMQETFEGKRNKHKNKNITQQQNLLMSNASERTNQKGYITFRQVKCKTDQLRVLFQAISFLLLLLLFGTHARTHTHTHNSTANDTRVLLICAGAYRKTFLWFHVAPYTFILIVVCFFFFDDLFPPLIDTQRHYYHYCFTPGTDTTSSTSSRTISTATALQCTATGLHPRKRRCSWHRWWSSSEVGGRVCVCVCVCGKIFQTKEKSGLNELSHVQKNNLVLVLTYTYIFFIYIHIYLFLRQLTGQQFCTLGLCTEEQFFHARQNAELVRAAEEYYR